MADSEDSPSITNILVTLGKTTLDHSGDVAVYD